jgi:hypothetical protein
LDGGTYLKLVNFGDEFCINDSAPKMIAKILEYEYDDMSSVLMTNEKLFRDVVTYTVKNDIDDCIFLIGWTTPYRRDNEFAGEYFVYSPENKDYPSNRFNTLHKYDHYLFDNVLINNTWVGLVYGLQQYLESLNIKYYMYNTQEKIEFNEHTGTILRNLNNKQYHNPLNLESTMLHYLKKQGHNDIGYHAHKEWAQFILQKFRAIGLINRK